MSKVVVVYQSRYGAVRTYAEWLGGMLGSDIYDLDTKPQFNVREAEVLICCGAIYWGRLSSLGWLHSHAHLFGGRHIILLAVGAMEKDEEQIEQYRGQWLRRDLEHLPLVYARGCWDPDHFSRLDRFKLSLYQTYLTHLKPEQLTAAQRGFLALQERGDWCSKKNLLPIIDFCQRLLLPEQERWARRAANAGVMSMGMAKEFSD